MDLSVIIPVLDEEITIIRTLSHVSNILKLIHLNSEIIIIDNGCKDNTIKLASKFNVKIVKETQVGYGNAIRKGIKSAMGKIIILIDGDNTYDVTQLPTMIELMNKNDLILGNRLIYKDNLSAFQASHYVGNKILSFLIKRLFRISIIDSQSGFRVFHRQKFLKLNLKSSGMEYALNMLLLAHKKNYRISEIPIRYYSRLKGSESKLSMKRDSFRILKQIFVLLSPQITGRT